MLSEFDLIARYFTRPPRRQDVSVGIGDDCALLIPDHEAQLAISSDMLVEGRHFFPGAEPHALGHKCLAVNLSDLAAMGAEPVAFTLALALPEANQEWLARFSSGLLELADRHGCELIGGDTTKGPLNICITIFGKVPPGQALKRDAARAGDDIWISGNLGDARLALAGYRSELDLDESTLANAAGRMHRPTPRVELGMALRGIARAAIDVSDGLSGDIAHILKKSAVGARLQIDALPAGPMLAAQDQSIRRRFMLAGGDDYELCFTAPASMRDAVLHAAAASGTAVTRVGVIEDKPGLRLVDRDGAILDLETDSFDHFTSP
ncbi:MAG TPA: thiamine-phosphate kinase [Noviherbaspirillum sp.]|jgi:thiamine-monophosphate kinase|uniref:thiamine-phosphate kinase n=1 Tax=Noviherbaspirillum sp. TaxID=1926288 RepID=UPI002DDD3723|nr:thiamine-phosphate kinase [Noviherbaspirillum sp.]HEV2609509.1 thiamine-phosphate kinase [Noviherbaspirillum sp.]